MRSRNSPTHPVVAVTGASGGLGASTLAGAVAGCAGAALTLVDGDVRAGGIDVTVGAEHEPGLRWPDLARHEGPVVADQLRDRLPAAPWPVLAARGAGPAEGTVVEVVRGLSTAAPVVLDLPVRSLPERAWAEVPDLVVLLVGLRPRWLRDGETHLDRLGALRQRTALVTRGAVRPRGAPERVAEHLGLPLLEHLPDDPQVVRAEARGGPPGRRGACAEVARVVVEVAGLGGRRGRAAA